MNEGALLSLVYKDQKKTRRWVYGNTKSGTKEKIGLVELTFCLACDGVVLQFDGAPILVLVPDLLEWIPGAACALWQKLLGPFYWNGNLKKPLLAFVGFALQQQRGMSLRFEADEVCLTLDLSGTISVDNAPGNSSNFELNRSWKCRLHRPVQTPLHTTTS